MGGNFLIDQNSKSYLSDPLKKHLIFFRTKDKNIYYL